MRDYTNKINKLYFYADFSDYYAVCALASKKNQKTEHK